MLQTGTSHQVDCHDIDNHQQRMVMLLSAKRVSKIATSARIQVAYA